MKKVIVADGIDQEGLEPLSPCKEAKIVFVDKQEDLEKEIVDAEILLVRSKTKVTPELMDKSKTLRYVGRAGVGVDNININEASKRNIVVANVPGGNTISAAEHSFALLLALSRNVAQAHATMVQGRWDRKLFVGTELLGKTLGLIGFGRIGREVGSRALAFGMKVMVYDPFVSQDHIRSLNAEPGNLEDVLKNSDYISLHMPVTPQTKHMINSETLKLLKPNARLINCARGELVDEAALVQALKDGKIKGAALDVFSSEPPENKDLLTLPNLILTPHLGASTEEAQSKVAVELAACVRDFIEKGEVRNAVNLPSLEKEVLEKNKPYILLSERMGQFLAQIVSGGIQSIKIEYSGDFSNALRNYLSRLVIKGALVPIIGREGVNILNARVVATDRGIQIEEVSSNKKQDFNDMITVTLKTDQGQKSVSGAVLFGDQAHIVRIDDLSVDIGLEGNLLVFTNKDQPGVVGFIGTILGENQINIAKFQVGRKKEGAQAVSILDVDSVIPQSVIDQIRQDKRITNVWPVTLKADA